MSTIEEIASVLKNSKRAVIFTHMRPDGDTLGCGMALHRALSLCGIQSEVVNEGEVPARFGFLEGLGEIKTAPSMDADTFVAVDASDPARLGMLETVFRAGAKKKTTVNIDHHISNTMYARYNFVRTFSSNAENVLAVILAMGVTPDRAVYEFLLLGMVTDSGNFTHGDVNGETLRAAAMAVDGGADLGRISYEGMRKQSKARAQLYAETVSHLRYLLDDKLAVAIVTAEQLKRFGLGSDATEGIVDFALTVECVVVSVCLLEVKRGQYKVSLRSKGKVNVNDVARTFGGGGHVLASGCMIFGELEEAVDRLRYAVWQHAGDL